MYRFVYVGTCPTYMFSFHAEVFVRIRAIKGANAPIPFRGAGKEKSL